MVTIKKSTLYLVGTIMLVAIGAYLLLGNNAAQTTPSLIAQDAGSGAVQEVIIGMKNYNYYPNTVTVKAGAPVRISLDNSVAGCFRDFTIREFGVHQYLASPQDYVEFTPTKQGTYTFACSMGMGTGTLVVE